MGEHAVGCGGPRGGGPLAIARARGWLKFAPARPQITNTAKLKRMSKKQLKMVRKADTSGVAPKDVARQAIFPKIGGKPGKGRR